MKIVFDNRVCIEAEVALNHNEKQRGLMFRDHLGKQAGMLFIYNNQPAAIWMKNTLVPLDILFCKATKNGGHVIKVAHGVPFSQEIIGCEDSVDYVIELNKGFCDENKIRVGMYFSIDKVDDIRNRLNKVANVLEKNRWFKEAEMVDTLLERKK